MVVRVKVRIRPLKGTWVKELETVAEANSAFESKGPEVIVPTRLAEKLGFWPTLPEGAEVGVYGVAGGGEVKAYRIKGALDIRALAHAKISNPVRASVAVMEGERKVILSDKSIDKLGIELIMPGAGIWKFRGEEKLRKSEKPKYW